MSIVSKDNVLSLTLLYKVIVGSVTRKKRKWKNNKI